MYCEACADATAETGSGRSCRRAQWWNVPARTQAARQETWMRQLLDMLAEGLFSRPQPFVLQTFKGWGEAHTAQTDLRYCICKFRWSSLLEGLLHISLEQRPAEYPGSCGPNKSTIKSTVTPRLFWLMSHERRLWGPESGATDLIGK